MVPDNKLKLLAEIVTDALRYRHLRDGKRSHDQAPFVFHPQSRLYAVKSMRGQVLDEAIAEDVLNGLCNKLHIENALVERGLRPEHVHVSFIDEEYCRLVEELAMKEIGDTVEALIKELLVTE